MSSFEFVFSLIGLVLGLSLVEVLGGLAKTVKAGRLRGAWLTPLLGVWVISDIATFWGATWEMRALLPVWPTLGVGVLLGSAYFLAASFVFPDRDADWSDLDAHYWRHRRKVIGLILSCWVVFWSIGAVLGRHLNIETILINVAFFAATTLTWWARGKRVSTLGLLTLITINVAAFILPTA